MTIEIEKDTDLPFEIDYEPIIRDIIEEAISYVDCPYEISVNVILTSNDQIAAINKEYRGIDRSTDVLSFPAVDYKKEADFDGIEETAIDYFDPDSGELILGDIIISVEKVKEQAEAYNHSLKRELAFLTAHSMLHLYGYDHMEESEREIMEKKQEEILIRKGYTRNC